LFTICASPAFGAGYGLKEHSADAMAAAYAGAAATSSDASYLAYNPASLAGVSDSDFAVNAVAIFPGSKSAYTSATTSAGTPTGGDLTPRGYISGAVVPAFAFRARLTDQWAIGLDVSAPWGLKTDYPAGWAGRYYAEKTQLLTINATPAVSWQPMPGLALGVGVQVEYAQGKLTTAIDTGTLGALNGIPGSLPGGQDSFAQLDGTNWTFGFTLGAMAKLSGDLTAGLSYRSSLQHDLEGPLTFTLDSTGTGAAIRSLTGLFTDTHATVPLTMPDMVSFGLRDRLADDWYGMIELDWTHWSRFRELRISAANPAQPDNVTTTHWHNAMFGSIGFEYHASESLSLRGGIAYDQSPVPDATREPRIPDSDRIWLSAGVRYRLSDDMDVNVTLSRLFFLKSDVALVPTIPGAALRGTLTGTAQAYANVAGLQFSYRTE
jgi:long-chain fatty acid transport protein